MSDFDPAAHIEARRALSPELRARKAEVTAAALREVGIPAQPNLETGGVRTRVDHLGTPEQHYRAGVIGARAVGLEPISFEDWATLRLFRNPRFEPLLRRELDR